jgi:hypothetical protein
MHHLYHYSEVSYNCHIGPCVSKVKMSPITAELKCPHGRGKNSIESGAVTEVAFHEDGGGREDHLEGGRDVTMAKTKGSGLAMIQ